MEIGTIFWENGCDVRLACGISAWPGWSGAAYFNLSQCLSRIVWPRLSYREQFKEEDEEADRGNDGKTTSKSGLAFHGTSHYGKLRTERSGGSWL